jgi:heptosyltransferase-2
LPERFARVASLLASETGAAVALFGSAAERGLCEAVAGMIPSQAPVVNLAGRTTLREFIEYAAACRLFITNDSGAMHIVAALGTPSVAVFGSTNPAATSPVGPAARIVREPVECSPCLLRDCPIDHRCMTRVTVKQVAATALELWKQQQPSGYPN